MIQKSKITFENVCKLPINKKIEIKTLSSPNLRKCIYPGSNMGIESVPRSWKEEGQHSERVVD